MPIRPFESMAEMYQYSTRLSIFYCHLNEPNISKYAKFLGPPTDQGPHLQPLRVSSMPSLRRAFAVAAVLFAAKTPMPRSYAQKMPKASHAFTAKMCAGGLDSVGPDFVGVERLILGWYRMFVQIEGLICTIRGSL